MTIKARIVNNQVVEILDMEPFPQFHPDLVWVPGIGAHEGDGWDGVNFIPQPTPYDRWNGSSWIHDQVAEDRANAAAIDTAEIDEIKADGLVQQFVARTPAQVGDWVDANVTDLASAKAVLKLMAKMLLIIARRLYRTS